MIRNELKELDELSLWNLMTQGHEQALELLYAKYYDSLYYYGQKYSRDTSLIEDCVQDVFVAVFNNSRLKSVHHVQAYLLRSLRNLLFKQLSLQPHCTLEELAFDISIEDTQLTTLFQNDDESLQVSKNLMNAYRSLTENQKNAIYLRYVKEMSYQEIADVLEVNAQSAQNAVSRTLAKLKSMMLLFI
ncbi:MAG: sigma-70 family RNA polymerase sigma factor [Bacteroides sp.]